ncbi:hypothetical protein F5Y17DRAFT_332542 [Xylariaceae sp. FL0594]|nr:hypothetical protein F5Y17DRAFT_332542 [Xylariaceae sp. FL0594]
MRERASLKMSRRSFVHALPTEIRLEIYRILYADLIRNLRDSLFGLFWLCDGYLYDHTKSHLAKRSIYPESKYPFRKTGLTALLHTCKEVHGEAALVLYQQAEIYIRICWEDVANIDTDGGGFIRLTNNCRLLRHARNVRINIAPLSTLDESFLKRVRLLVECVNYGANIYSLKIRISVTGLKESRRSKGMMAILVCLSSLRTTRAIEIFLDCVPRNLLSDELLELFLNTVKGTLMGRGDFKPLAPLHFCGEEEDSDEGT